MREGRHTSTGAAWLSHRMSSQLSLCFHRTHRTEFVVICRYYELSGYTADTGSGAMIGIACGTLPQVYVGRSDERYDWHRRRKGRVPGGSQHIANCGSSSYDWLSTSGTPPAFPKRRYAKRIPLASTNCVGAVWWLYWIIGIPLDGGDEDDMRRGLERAVSGAEQTSAPGLHQLAVCHAENVGLERRGKTFCG